MLNSKKQITLNTLNDKFINVSFFSSPIFSSFNNFLQIKNLKKFELTPSDFCLKRKKSRYPLKFSKKKTLKNYFKFLNKKKLKSSTKKVKFLQNLVIIKKATNNFLKNQYLKQQVSTKCSVVKNLKFSPIFLNRRNLSDTDKTNRFSSFFSSFLLLASFEKRRKIKMKSFKSRLSLILSLFSLRWRYNSFFFSKKKSLWSGLFGLKASKPTENGKATRKSNFLLSMKILKKKEIFCLKNRYSFKFFSAR